MAGNNEIREEYMSSLADLTFNSKPLISVLTILAEENIAHAKDIVEAIETHLSRVNIKVKLPVLYLIDCIIKNVGRNYTTLFCQNIVATFCGVFEQVDERTRAEMFKLRQTWNEVIPPKKLYALDVQIAQLDPAWPVTAPPPKSIHFNPKFLKTTSTTVTSTIPAVTKTQASPLITNTNTNSLDTKTLTMQQKLITKQRELLELQQRKLELELLQTQVKLQEQLKTNTTTTTGGGSTASTTLGSSQNVLLKPEVAKQLSQSNTTSDSAVRNVKSKSVSHTLNARSQSTTGSTRTAPTNTRAIRDPRLMRHLQQQAQQQQQQHHENVSTTINSVLVENKLKAGNQVSLDSENKIVNNKSNVRNDRIEHRLVNNKGNIESHGKSKTSPNSSSPLKHTQKIGGSRKNVKSKLFSNETTTNLAQIKSSDIKNKSDTKNTSRSNLKFKKKISSSNASSSNNNGSSICTMRSEKDAGTSSRLSKDTPPASSSLDKNSNLGRYDKSDSSTKNGGEKKSSDKHANKSIKSGKDKLHHKSDPAFFKDLKGSTKNRNYIRRNQNAPPPLCGSPEPNQDVDLRVVGLPEKQPRLPGDIIDDKNAIPDPTSQPMDVDLRQIPATIVAGKKRPSMDSSDSPNAKKSKSEVFDVLFGREDTDLRQLPSVLSERPQTPPPPIISEKVITIRDDDPPEAMEVDKAKLSNFNAIRAKLANAVIQESEELQQNKRLNLDMDMRRLSDSSHEQILISEDEEAIIRANKMTVDQQKSIANKIVTQIETQKLREAQRKESESMSNTSLQPISDDEFEAEFEFSSSDSDNAKKDGNYKKKTKTKRDALRNTTESRIPPLIPQNQLDETYNKFNRTADFRNNDPRRGRNWRGGRHRQKVWETNPPQFAHPLRPPIEQWARPPANDAWRPNPFEGRPTNISPHLLDQRSQSPINKFQDNPTLQFVHPDSYKFITIDGEPREIRYYDETAIVFLSAGDPREISFQNGSRRISFDGEIYELHFNEPYQEINIRGRMHRVRLGGPSREIFMDGNGYQCYFDSIEKTIDLDGNTIVVKLEPPPPQVSIGQEKRLDLVAGKIQLIVDAKNMFTVFLDSKVQNFEVDGMKHSLKFIEGLRAVLIDDVRFEVEYGGLPKPVKLQNRKYFVRFSVLPDGIKPGQVVLRDMDTAFQRENENSQESSGVRQSRFTPIVERHSPERNSNSPSFFQNFIRNPNLDMLSSVMASSLIPSASESSYKVENDEAPQPEQPVVPDVAAQEQKPGLNINELFQRLVATGIVGTANKPQAPEPPIVHPTPPPPAPKTASKNFVPIYFDKPETLKSRHSLRFSVLTMGMQCSSCGMRFPPEDTIRYSQHLDWHFRQNRKGKKNLRAAPGRPWYYSKSDWNNYTEIEDLEEREKSYFENQSLNQVEGGKEEVDEEEEIPCVAADPNVQVAICDVCHDRFEQFFNEETEEWQLRKAIRVDDRVYHPLCYEDYQVSMEKSVSEEESVTIPGLETTSDTVADDDDDEDKKKKEEEDEVMEVIDNIDDESPLPDEKEQAKEEEEEEVGEEEEDDDVILNEVIPEKIIVDDDDKDDYVANDHGLIPGVVVKVEPIDDGFVDVEDGVLKLKSDEVKIKSEPGTEDEMDTSQALDLGDDIMEVREVPEHVAPTHTEVVSSIDGNLEFESGVTPASTGLNTKIKINITKPLPAVVAKDPKDVASDDLKNETVDPSQPLPPGEEPVQLNLKPTLRGVSLKRQPVVRKGVELSGLCSIM